MLFTLDENLLMGVHVMDELAVGTVFTSTDDAIACVDRYNETNFTNFVVRSRTSQVLLYRCRHGIQRTSKCKGVRPNQHYNFVGCEATIRMYKSKNGSLKVTLHVCVLSGVICIYYSIYYNIFYYIVILFTVYLIF